MLEKVKDLVKIIFLTVIIAGIVVWFCWEALDTNILDDFFNDRNSHEVDAVLLFLTGIATAALAIGAYIQIKHLNENTQAEFLLKIDERWMSPEILKARTIIHGIELGIIHQQPNNLEENIGQEIIQLSTKQNEKENFMYLLNFLDFMETIGFLFSKGRVDDKDLDELCGDSIRFYFKVFKPYINFKKKKDNFSYESFKKLYEALEREQTPQ